MSHHEIIDDMVNHLMWYFSKFEPQKMKIEEEDVLECFCTSTTKKWHPQNLNKCNKIITPDERNKCMDLYTFFFFQDESVRNFIIKNVCLKLYKKN